MSPITEVDGYVYYPGSKTRIDAMRPADPAKTPWTPLGNRSLNARSPSSPRRVYS